jgi:hypothetical protein
MCQGLALVDLNRDVNGPQLLIRDAFGDSREDLLLDVEHLAHRAVTDNCHFSLTG